MGIPEDIRVGGRVLVPADVLRIDEGGDGGAPVVFVRMAVAPGTSMAPTQSAAVLLADVIPILDPVADPVVTEDVLLPAQRQLTEDEYRVLYALLAEQGYRRVHEAELREWVRSMLNDDAVPADHDTFGVLIFSYLTERGFVDSQPARG